MKTTTWARLRFGLMAIFQLVQKFCGIERNLTIYATFMLIITRLGMETVAM